MEGNTFLGFSYSLWWETFVIFLIFVGVVAFLAVYVIVVRWFDRRAEKKGRKQPAWRRYYRSGNNSANLWDPPLPDCNISDDFDGDD